MAKLPTESYTEEQQTDEALPAPRYVAIDEKAMYLKQEARLYLWVST